MRGYRGVADKSGLQTRSFLLLPPELVLVVKVYVETRVTAVNLCLRGSYSLPNWKAPSGIVNLSIAVFHEVCYEQKLTPHSHG